MKLCQFCDQPSESDTIPPLCSKHWDLHILAEYLRDAETIVTITALQFLIELGLSRGGEFEATPGEVQELVTSEFAAEIHLEGIR